MAKKTKTRKMTNARAKVSGQTRPQGVIVIRDQKFVAFKGTFAELAKIPKDQIVRIVPLKPPSDKAPNIKLVVSAWIIATSVQNSKVNCMVVRAVKKWAIENGYDTWSWNVSDGELAFNLNHEGIGTNCTRFYYKLPPFVSKLIEDFDGDKNSVKPFKFSLRGSAAKYKAVERTGPRAKRNKPRDKSKPYGSIIANKPEYCNRRHLGRTVVTEEGIAKMLAKAQGANVKTVPSKKSA